MLTLPPDDTEEALLAAERAKARVDADIESAGASGVHVTPTFFINGRRYDGAWDGTSLTEAMRGTLGQRLRSVSCGRFRRLSPSAGVLLLIATCIAIALTNSGLGEAFTSLWEQELGFSVGHARFTMSILEWIDNGLLTIFFLVVGLEIKREFTLSAPLQPALRRTTHRSLGDRRHDRARPALPSLNPDGTLVARMGRPDDPPTPHSPSR